jgi:hypothetical protein
LRLGSRRGRVVSVRNPVPREGPGTPNVGSRLALGLNRVRRLSRETLRTARAP